MFTLYQATMLVSHGGTLYTSKGSVNLRKLNILSNIWSLGKRTDFNLWEMSSLSVSNNITISLTLSTKWFLNCFSIVWHCKPRIVLFLKVSKTSPLFWLNKKLDNCWESLLQKRNVVHLCQKAQKFANSAPYCIIVY